MTTGEVVAEGCTNLRQGDVIAGVRLPPGLGAEDGSNVAILTQTCDVVQPSKTRCLVAPVLSHDPIVISGARKGRRPLHLLLEVTGDGPNPCVVDMECATSILKSDLVGNPLVARYVTEASSKHAGDVAARIGRAFNRFPFPNEVHPFFNDLRNKVKDKSGTMGPFGQVLDLVEDVRVKTNQWTDPGRRLILFVIVASELLILPDDYNPNWAWSEANVHNLSRNETPESLNLNRVCELILANLGRDATTLAILWTKFGDRIFAELLQPNLNSEVSDCRVDVLSDRDMTYRDYRLTESLDFEVLSNSTLPTA